MTKHALLGPSGAYRWMNCTPSAREEEKYQETRSTYAEEGTTAHMLAEAILADDPDAANDIRKASPYYNAEMEEAVGIYIETVTEAFNRARAKTPDAVMFLEQRLDFSAWVPEGFGTGDVVIISDGEIEVIDLKYGKGVLVQSENNPQLRLYGLGAWAAFDLLYDIRTVKMTICQPRLDMSTTASMTTEELLEWAESAVKPKAQMAWAGEGDFKAGDHCKFCKAKNRCRALAEYNLELARFDFRDPNRLEDYEIAEILSRIDGLTTWASSIKDYALEQSERHGVKWPGWKLVEGRSNRKYSDDGLVLQTLILNGYEKDKLYKPSEILGITAMENIVGKKRFQELLGDLIIKPAGKPTLVPETDKRPELNTAASAADDFKN